MLLQVQNADGAWTDVTAPRGTVTVLAGYTLERATCGLIKASNHRVVRSNISGTAVAHACFALSVLFAFPPDKAYFQSAWLAIHDICFCIPSCNWQTLQYWADQRQLFV